MARVDLGCGCRVLGGVPDVRLGDEVGSAGSPGFRHAGISISRMRGLKGEPAAPARNWALLLMVVLCVEFWMIVTTSVASHI